jgi:hypothetical protein
VITLWLLISCPLVLWDTGYVLTRPHSMPGGKWHRFWSGYRWYAGVDYIYGWPAYNANNGFTAAQGVLNLAETAGYLYYLWVVYRFGTPANVNANARDSESTLNWVLATEKVVAGRMGATALLAAFSASVSTLSKTLLYCECQSFTGWTDDSGLQEYFSNYENIGHNEFWPLLAWTVMKYVSLIGVRANRPVVFGSSSRCITCMFWERRLCPRLPVLLLVVVDPRRSSW